MEKINGKTIMPVATVLDANTPLCANCTYFRLREDLQENVQTFGAGECRRYPPKVFFNQVLVPQPTGRILSDRSAEMTQAIGYQMQMQNPIVKNDFFCGEHPEMRANAEFEAADARLDATKDALPELGTLLQKTLLEIQGAGTLPPLN